MKKAKMDKMGSFLDTKFRLANVRKFLCQRVQEAREKIYKLGIKIHGVVVENLLKEDSSVPTMVIVINILLL